MLFKNKYEKKIFTITFLMRILMLIVIFILSEYMERGFISSDMLVDDWRYEEGGIYYSLRDRKSVV